MQPTEEALKTLAQCFLQTLAPDPEPRKQAEAYLKQAADQPGYGLTVLSLLTAPAVDDQIRQSAAVNFKNYIKYRWSPNDADVERLGELVPIQEGEKDQIKAHIVELMLSAPAKVQVQLSDALAIISNHDFPAKWQNLLPELVAKLSSADYRIINGVLQTANSIFKRFRFQFKSAQLYEELKYCLDLFALPLLELVKRTEQLVAANQNAPDVLKLLIECQRTSARIFFSLNSQELPEVFEDHIKEWMSEFHRYLTYENPLLEEKGDKESILDSLKAAICENINLYMEKNEEEFKDFLPTFVKDVWDLLMKVGLTSKHDQLAITAIRFLTTVSVSVHHTLFSDPATLQNICEGIVIPNLAFRDEDEELFEMNHVEYIRRDMEGSDNDTRRRIACELVKGLATHYEAQITQLFSAHVAGMLGKFSANPEQNWKDKDCSIYLVVALTVRQKTAAAGATAVNSLVNVGDFFSTQILPELTAPDVNERPVLKADALKFITTFRSQLPKSSSLELLPQLMRYIGAESNVVHSYAASCIERLLVVKDAGKPRFIAADIRPIAEQLLSSLFGALKLPESNENQYVMKCIMRVVSMTSAGPAAPVIMAELSSILMEVCKNPRNPSFNHYVFEAVAALVRNSTSNPNPNPSAPPQVPPEIPAFESSLFPVLQTVLSQDVQEFAPYCFQILALLVESRPPPLPPSYMAVFGALIAPALWERSANVPALVRLLQAYLQKAANEIVSSSQLAPVLGVFQKLVASKHSDHHGFFILNTVVEHLSPEALAPYLKTIWSLLFHRMQTSRTPKFLRGLLVLMALFAARHGPAPLVDSINSVQPGVFLQLVEPVWVATLPSISGKVETKLCAVASVKLLTESPALQGDATLNLWGRLLDATLTLLVRPEEERPTDEDDGDVPELEEIPGYTAVFAQLYNAGKKEDDPIPQIKNPREFLVRKLGELTGGSPGKYLGVVGSSLQPANQAALQQWSKDYGVAIR